MLGKSATHLVSKLMCSKFQSTSQHNWQKDSSDLYQLWAVQIFEWIFSAEEEKYFIELILLSLKSLKIPSKGNILPIIITIRIPIPEIVKQNRMSDCNIIFKIGVYQMSLIFQDVFSFSCFLIYSENLELKRTETKDL